jgi:hypothetical protein
MTRVTRRFIRGCALAAQQASQLSQALRSVEDAAFVCGEWTRDDDEEWENVYSTLQQAQRQMRRLLGLDTVTL